MLSEHLVHSKKFNFTGRRAVELGAGAGLPGLTIATLGESFVHVGACVFVELHYACCDSSGVTGKFVFPDVLAVMYLAGGLHLFILCCVL